MTTPNESSLAITYPARVATVVRETGEVSSIALMSAPPNRADKRQDDMSVYEYVAVGPTARVGMVRQPGGFDWPVGHPNESIEARRERAAAAAKQKAA